MTDPYTPAPDAPPNLDDYRVALRALEHLHRHGDRESRMVARTALRRIERDRERREGRERESYAVALANCNCLRGEDVP